MRTKHYVTLGMFLMSFALLLGGLDHWEDAIKPKFIAGVVMAAGTLIKAMNEDGPSTDASTMSSVTHAEEKEPAQL